MTREPLLSIAGNLNNISSEAVKLSRQKKKKISPLSYP